MTSSLTATGRPPAFRVAMALAAAAMVLSACEALHLPRIAPPRPADVQHGEPIDAGPKPPPAACDQRLRSEVGAAVRLRASMVAEKLHLDEAHAAAVASDPRAAIEPSYGIPMTPAEVTALWDEGPGAAIGGPEPALLAWVIIGARDRFGGMWQDPGDERRWVAAVPPGDSQTLTLARCLESDPALIRYVAAARTLAAADAFKATIEADFAALEALGIKIGYVYYREDEGTFEIGVPDPTPAISGVLTVRYGPEIRVEKEILVSW